MIWLPSIGEDKGNTLPSFCCDDEERSDPAAIVLRSLLGVTGTWCEDPRCTVDRRGEVGGLTEAFCGGEADMLLP